MECALTIESAALFDKVLRLGLSYVGTLKLHNNITLINYKTNALRVQVSS